MPFTFTRRELIQMASAFVAAAGLDSVEEAKAAGSSSVSVTDLRCEYRVDPLGIDTDAPRLSWRLVDPAGRRGQRQTAYRILVASTPARLAAEKGDAWDSGRVRSDQSLNIPYAGLKLRSSSICFWKVMVWDRDGKPSLWSAPARFALGLLAKTDWSGNWIGMASAAETDCPWLRKTFMIEDDPEIGLAHVGSIGFHELTVNGQKVDDRVLSPNVSNLQSRALTVTYDIKPYLKRGKNVVAIWLAPGWSVFRDGNPNVDFHVKKKPLCIAQILFGPDQNRMTKVGSDPSWRCSLSSTRHLGRWQNSDFGGDHVDAAKEAPGWNDVTFDDAAWEPATIYDPGLILSPDLAEPNRKCDTIPAAKVEQVGPRKYRFTMAKLYTGWIEIKLSGSPGSMVTIMASSLPERDVEYNQLNQFVLGSEGAGTFCNRFSYHEVKYVTVDGIDTAPAMAYCVGYRISNDRKRIGSFDCSNRLLKQIYDTTINTYVNLTTGGMTVDCPHRERLGYGGDGHTSLEIALDSFESAAFFSKWAQDWVNVQKPDGDIYHTAPTMGGGGGPAWGGFVVVMPWETYAATGDCRILEKTYPTAQKWLAFLDAHTGADGLLSLPGQWYFLGDWVTPHGSEESTSPEALLFNNCYFLYVSRLAAQIAAVLGLPREEHLARVKSLRQAINQRFFRADLHCYLDTRETHCVMPLVSGAVPEEEVVNLLKTLEHEILTTQKGHLDTGLHGTYFMTKYLAEASRSDLVFTWATQITFPGYGDLLAKGYETWSESWGGSASRMHGCLNGIGGWFQRGLAGIRPDPAYPGFKQFTIQPAIVGDLTWVQCSHKSPYGVITSNWKRDGTNIELEIAIPPNTTATVHIPAPDPGSVSESGRPANRAPGVKFRKMENGAAVWEVESGTYQFRSIISA